MKKTLASICVVASCITPNLASAQELGIYTGSNLGFDLSSRTQGKSSFMGDVFIATETVKNVYYGRDLNLTSYGLGFGYNYANAIKNLDVFGVAGYGYASGKVDGLNLVTKKSESGLYIKIGANYSLKSITSLPLTIGLHYTQLPEFTVLNKTVGGGGFNVGGSWTF